MGLLQKILLVFLVCYSMLAKTQDTLTVMAYNILNYPTSNPTKADTLKPIIKHVNPDIFLITELTSSTGVTSILNDALNVDGVSFYQNATYNNGPDTDNMLFYNTNKLVLYSQFEISTALRNISEYVLYYKTTGLNALSDTLFIHCYMAHLKASSGAINEQKRNQEAILFKNYLDSKQNLENVIFGGDFNLYSNLEPAHNTILNGGSIALFDPISSSGNWHNNYSFADVHTQSTRSGSLADGGSYGGMDDRFDFIFFTDDLQTGENDLTYVEDSYIALGNDGNHFNKSINATPINTAVPANIANALYYMSDHLPVVLKAEVPLDVGVLENEDLNSWTGYLSLNNFIFKTSSIEKELTVFVCDLLGKTIQTKKYINKNEFSLSFESLKQGVYFVKVISGKRQKTFKIFKR